MSNPFEDLYDESDPMFANGQDWIDEQEDDEFDVLDPTDEEIEQIEQEYEAWIAEHREED